MVFVLAILFLHVTAALWLAVGALGCLVVRGRLRAQLDGSAQHFAVDLLHRLHRLYTLPGVLVAGLLGFSLVTSTGYQFVQLWIAGAAFLWVVLFHVTLFGINPRLAALARAKQRDLANPEDPPRLPSLLAKPGWRRLLDLQALLLLAIIALMTIKP